ncbi:MAG: TIGR01777 family oxidoreductase [Longimicrobiaceae bacterium]
MNREATRTVAVSGASGLIGGRLTPFLAERGWKVLRLVRGRPSGEGEILWDLDSGKVDDVALEGIGAVVHLAGEPIASGWWTRAKKREIRRSRVEGTRLLAEALAGLRSKPEVLVSASAVGYYGDRGDERLSEESSAGRGFLAEVAREWEAAAEPARRAGIRVVTLRNGIVLAGGGGMLGRLLVPFELGLGGVVGKGDQWVSWIAMEDLLRVVERSLEQGALSGPVNAVAPEPVRNRELAKTLGKVLRRPVIIPLPAAALKLLLGEMAKETLLASTRALPDRLGGTGFDFRHPTLEGALRSELDRPA